MNLLKYIWRRRKFIAVASILITLIYYAINCFNIYFSETGTISFIYPNSENGQYPDGTRFNIYDLMSEEVLQGTVDIYNERTGKYPIKLENIENAIEIDELNTSGIQAKVQSARNLGQDYSYFANEYRVSVSPVCGVYSRSFKNLFGVIPDVDNKFLIESLYKSYTEYFMESHVEMNIIPKITDNIGYEGYDYIEIANVFETRINMYITYLESKLRENGSYNSTKTNRGFNDLIAEFRNLRDIQVKNLKSFVSSSKLAKNPPEFINKLRVQNESYTLYYNKLADEADAARIAMTEYDHTYEENIVITGQNEEIGLYQARPKTAYDTITKRALDVGVSAQSVLKDIEENERLISEYSSTVMSEETQARLSSTADRLVSEIETMSDNLVTLADETISDYLEARCSDYVRFAPSGKSYFNMNIILRMLIIFMLSVVGAILYLYLFDRNQKPRVQEITEALGIKMARQNVFVNLLIRFENKMILKREKKLQKKMGRKNKNSDSLVMESVEFAAVPMQKGRIEKFFDKHEKKKKKKDEIREEKERAKKEKKARKKSERARRRRKESQELIFDVEERDAQYLDNNAENSEEITMADVQSNELHDLLAPVDTVYDRTEEIVSDNIAESSASNVSSGLGEGDMGESHLKDFSNSGFDANDGAAVNKDFANVDVISDANTKKTIWGKKKSAKPTKIKGKKAREENSIDSTVKEPADTEFYDLFENNASEKPLGNISDRIDEILNSQSSVIDELLNGTGFDIGDESDEKDGERF